MAPVNRGKRLRQMPQDEYRQKLKYQLLSHIEIDEETGCWIWVGGHQVNGYASTRMLGKGTPAHRASFYAFNGYLPDGHDVCHICDVRNCINPDHLFTATHAENMTDMQTKGRGRNGVMSGAYSPVRNKLGQFTRL